MTQKTFVGIIGCGLIADTHVEAIQSALPEASISVCDPLEGKAELLCRKYNLAQSYTSIDAMFDAKHFDAVHILTPPRLHVEQTQKCLQQGCNVLVEKPLSFKVEEVIALYDEAQRQNRMVCVDHSLLFQPSVERVLAKLRANEAGKVLHVNCFYGIDASALSPKALPTDHWKKGLPGGAIIDTIIHPVTLAVELTGAPNNISVQIIGPSDNPEEVLVSWQGSGGLVNITVSANAQPFRRVTEVTTSAMTFIIDHSMETLVELDAGIGPKAARKLIRSTSYGTQMIKGTISTVSKVLLKKLKENPGTRALIAAFYRNILHNGPMPVNLDNVCNATIVLQEIIAVLTKNKTYSTGTAQAPISPPKPNRQTILITGASGMLGSLLCEKLSLEGYAINAQVRRGLNADKLQIPNVNRIFQDFGMEDTDYEYIVKGATDVIHCAHAAGAKTWRQFKKVNVDASLALYNAAAAAGCKRFIFISSVAVYGLPIWGKKIVTERSKTTLGKSKYDFYIRSKTLAERALIERANQGGPQLLILRPGVLYTPDGKRLARRAISMKKNSLLIVFGNGKNHMPYTRADVLADFICTIMSRDPFPTGVYNTAGNPDLNFKNFIIDRMGRLGVTCKFVFIPAWPLRILTIGLETVWALSGRKKAPPLTRYLVDSAVRNVIYDSTKAQQELGWDPIAAIQP